MDTLLRDGLLADLPVVVAGRGPLGVAARDACAALGAAVGQREVDPLAEAEPPFEGEAAVVVWDAEAALAEAGPGVAGVRAALDGAWLAVRPVVTAAMIPDERGGKVVLLAPRPGDAHRAAARAGLENLARTLGIEWARFGIRTVTVLPGRATTDEAVAQLVAYLASPAGDYFSGCAITLGTVDPGRG
jgi:NAD(P)-dependent dehydrogenase (short-subunit alcohol dehydrogenase family)